MGLYWLYGSGDISPAPVEENHAVNCSSGPSLYMYPQAVIVMSRGHIAMYQKPFHLPVCKHMVHVFLPPNQLHQSDIRECLTRATHMSSLHVAVPALWRLHLL